MPSACCSNGDHIAKSLEEAKRGILSCFLLKGMEGDADSNKNYQISAGELPECVQANRIQQSSGLETTE